MRTKKSFYNYLAITIPQIIIAFLALFRTKYFLTGLGDEVYGIYQLFGQILGYLSLADLGLTEAINYYLYKPISEKNITKISGILVGAKKVFYKIMIIMFIIGLAFSPFVRLFISNYTVSEIFIIISFILSLLVYVITYISTPYTIMFDSNQEKYKYSIYTQSLLVMRYIVEIVVVLLFKNLYSVLIIEILFSILQNIIVRKLFKKSYSNINFKEKPNYMFKRKLNSIIPHKISSIISNNIDILLVSKILGIALVPIYTCNYYITNMINQIVGKLSSSTLASVGNIIASEKSKAFQIFLEYNTILFMLATMICAPLLVVMQPFIELWYGAEYVVNFITTLFFVLILFYNIIRIVLTNFTSSAGLYKETLICAISEGLINLIISLLLIRKLEILGIIIGTFLSLIMSEFMLKPFILNKYIFNKKISKYYFGCFKYFSLFLVNSVMLIFISKYLVFSNLFVWLVNGIILFCISFITVTIEYSIMKENYLWKRLKALKEQIITKK